MKKYLLGNTIWVWDGEDGNPLWFKNIGDEFITNNSRIGEKTLIDMGAILIDQDTEIPNLKDTRKQIVDEFEKKYKNTCYSHGDSTMASWSNFDAMNNYLTNALSDYTEQIVRMVESKKKDFLWLAFDDETGKEYIVDKEGYKKLPMEYSGHTIQFGYNQALDDIKEELEK